MSHEGFLKIVKVMGPLLVVMFLPMWLPLVVAVVGKLSDLIGFGDRRQSGDSTLRRQQNQNGAGSVSHPRPVDERTAGRPDPLAASAGDANVRGRHRPPRRRPRVTG
jgi:hypothetical protein